jgi:Resolvase, N terminal domain
LNGGNWRIIAEFTEIEGGKRSDRPALEKALAAARVRQAPLVVAKVDRLTRSVAFLSRLLEAGVDVRFADFPMIEGATQIPSAANGRRYRAGFYMAMPDFPIDPELHIRGSAPRVLRRTTEAMAFIQQMTLSRLGRTWLDVQQSFEEARDQWSAMEAVVKLELLLEAEGLLIEGKPASASTLSLQHPSRAA